MAAAMAKLAQRSLSKGWSFKESEKESPDAWMPVPAVPSVVQQGLQANNKYLNPSLNKKESC